MMRLMIEIEYRKVLLPEGTDTDAVLKAFAGAVFVDEERANYDVPPVYTITGKPLEIRPLFLNDAQIVSGEEALDVKNQRLKNNLSDSQKTVTELRKKVKELEAVGAVLVEAPSA